MCWQKISPIAQVQCYYISFDKYESYHLLNVDTVGMVNLIDKWSVYDTTLAITCKTFIFTDTTRQCFLTFTNLW